MTKSYVPFLTLLITTPLAFGTVEPWSLALMESAVAVGFALLLFRDIPGGQVRLRHVPGLAPLLCLLSYVFLQAVPLPAGLVKIISPAAFRIGTDTAALFGPVEWLSLSLAKKETVAEALRMAASGVFYVMTVQLLASGSRLKRTVYAVMIFSTLISVLAILQYLTYNQRIFWLRELTAGGTPFGPFVNRNHYAGFMEMVFPVALSVFLATRPAAVAGTFRDRLTGFLNHPRVNVHILSGLGCIVIATSIFLSLSRGGIISLGLSLIIFGILLLGRKAGRRRGVIMVAVCLVIILSVGWFGWQPIFDRFDKIRNDHGDIADDRKIIWADSARFIRDFPATGAGFGSFLALYPRYRSLEGSVIVDHAHNDYIELMTDGGVVAFALMAWFLAAALLPSYRAFRGRRDTFSVYLFMGSMAGICAILIHSLTDFNMHIGSNGLYFFFLAGLAVSAAHTRFHDGKQGETLLSEAPAIALRWARPLAALLAAATLLFSASTLLASYYFSAISGIRLQLLTDREGMEKVRGVARRAVLLDPLEPRYHAALGDTELSMGAPVAAAAAYRQAVSLSPSSGIFLQRLGRACSYMQDQAMAGRLWLAGIAAEPLNPGIHRGYALWLLAGGDRQEGLKALRRAIALEKGKTRDYIAILVLEGLRDEEIADALPGLVEPHLIFADYLAKTGKDEQAREEYRRALQYLPLEREPRPGHYLAPYYYFMRNGAYDEAVAVIREGVEALPRDAGMRLAAAEAYAKAGMMKRAAEEYRAVLLLDPGNVTASKRLEEGKVNASGP